jgi:hypothetical protein
MHQKIGPQSIEPGAIATSDQRANGNMDIYIIGELPCWMAPDRSVRIMVIRPRINQYIWA